MVHFTLTEILNDWRTSWYQKGPKKSTFLTKESNMLSLLRWWLNIDSNRTRNWARESKKSILTTTHDLKKWTKLKKPENEDGFCLVRRLDRRFLPMDDPSTAAFIVIVGKTKKQNNNKRRGFVFSKEGKDRKKLQIPEWKERKI